MSNAQATLGKAATSIEEIGTARQAAKAFVAALPHIMDCRRRIDEKNRLLKSMAAAGTVAGVGQPVDMADVDNAWDSFTAQLQQHDTHLDEQKNQLQGQLTRQVSTPRWAAPRLYLCSCCINNDIYYTAYEPWCCYLVPLRQQPVAHCDIQPCLKQYKLVCCNPVPLNIQTSSVPFSSHGRSEC